MNSHFIVLDIRGGLMRLSPTSLDTSILGPLLLMLFMEVSEAQPFGRRYVTGRLGFESS